MQVSVETTGNLERKMTVEVPAEEITSAWKKKLQGIGRRVKISGFRPGKVPLAVVKQRFGKQAFQEVVEDAMHSSYQEAVLQQKLRPAGSPSIKPLNLNRGEDLKYVATFEVYPEIDLADASELEIEVANVEITAGDVDDMLEKLRRQKMVWNEVDRAARRDDRVTIDFRGTMDGEEFDGGSREDFALIIGNGEVVPEFEEQLQGMAKDEAKSFQVTFPENYTPRHLAGKVATFEVKVKKVEAGKLPELDGAFVKEFGIEDGNLGALKKQIKDNMDVESKRRKKVFDKEQVMQCLVEANEIEVPGSLIQQEIQALRKQSMSQVGVKDESELPDTMFEKEARRRMSIGLIIGEIVYRNKIKLDNQRVNDHINMIASGYAKPDEVLKYYQGNHQAMASVESFVMEEQVVEWVLEQSRQTPRSFTFNEFVNQQS